MTTVEVHLDVGDQTVLVGQAHFTRPRGQISTSFLYDTNYLRSQGMSIDPSLPLVSGAQHQRGLVRAFADSAPDRWGRNLVEKAERTRARLEGRTPRRLDDLDFLLGVSDDTRQGALRFRLPGHEHYLGEPSQVPKLIALPQLVQAADELSSDGEAAAAVKMLLNTGTTGLGGARPKASIRLKDGSLGMAKFPHSSDQWDVMAWEATSLDLLDRIGIRTPQRQLARIGDRSVLVLRRFDRDNKGQRRGYISAMTAVGANDGDQFDYADIAEAIRDLSRSPNEDHRELFDRVVAYVALGNTDDHLRNHGFISERQSWELSPAFDVNPHPQLSNQRATSIMGSDSWPEEADSLIAFAQECGLKSEYARQRLAHVVEQFSEWKAIARSHDIAEREITWMSESIQPRLEAIQAVSGP